MLFSCLTRLLAHAKLHVLVDNLLWTWPRASGILTRCGFHCPRLGIVVRDTPRFRRHSKGTRHGSRFGSLALSMSCAQWAEKNLTNVEHEALLRVPLGHTAHPLIQRKPSKPCPGTTKSPRLQRTTWESCGFHRCWDSGLWAWSNFAPGCSIHLAHCCDPPCHLREASRRECVQQVGIRDICQAPR